MHSIQISQKPNNLVFQGTKNYFGIDSTNPKNFKSNQHIKNDKTNYLWASLACLSVLGAAIYVVKTKNKNVFKQFNEAFYNFSALTGRLNEANVKTQQDFLKNCIEPNLIGKGQNSKVYRFNNKLLDNWVIKVDVNYNYEDNLSSALTQIPDEFYGYNMGQPIAKIGDNIQILKKIEAKPHSIKNWSEHRRQGLPIEQQDAKAFLKDVKDIAKFPQEAFDEYARKLKLLDDKGYKADSFNPNNYMIDLKNKNLFIIDAYKYAPDEHINSKYDLICPLIDFPNFERFYDVMNSAEKQDYLTATKVLTKKCTIAAQKAGLKTTEDVFLDFIGRVDSREQNGQLYTNSYNAMKKILLESQ